MKRNHGAPPLAPLDILEAAKNRSHVLDTTKDEPRWFRIENKADDSSEADIYLYNEIGGWFGVYADEFQKELDQLDVQTINLHLNSPGGDVFEGVAIYNLLVQHKASIKVYVDGIAASAASFIAQAGDEVIMGLGSTMMIHDAWGVAWGNAEEMHKTADILNKLSDSISTFYAYRAGGTAQEWRAIMQEEAWYSAQEAVDAGLADRVNAEAKPKQDAAAADKFDLSVFNYAGRENAPAPAKIRQAVLNKINKESDMAARTAKASEEGTEQVEQTTPPPAPNTDPTEESTPEEQSTEAEPLPPAPVDPTEGDNPSNKAGASFVLNGVRTSDTKKVQAHIDSLEMFARESKASARDAYVDSLATDGKMVATQVEATKKLVATYTDEQYEMFRASWDAAPNLPLFGKHGVQGQSEPANEKIDRLNTLREIVQHHRNSGMKEDVLKTKDSFIEMTRLAAELGVEA